MKKNVAVVWGGYSSEIIVSEKSMAGVCSFLDKTRYNIFEVKLDRHEWTVNVGGEAYPVDKNDFSYTTAGGKTKFDYAFIIIHGTPGEDGRLQGYLDMLGIPYSCCGVMASALTFNKFICNNYLKSFGLKVADSVRLTAQDRYDVAEIGSRLGFPVFVKPNVGGSSFATTKVKTQDGLQSAINEAFEEAEEVIIESFISGTEVTCGCYKIDGVETIFPLTEVVTDNEFFDYNAKYNGQVDEITPARISDQLTQQIKSMTSRIYDLVGAKGIIRVDYIVSGEVPFLLEVNTTPGMTLTSFIPQQIKAAGLNITDVLTEIIENRKIG
ncbi:D-alanine-D-alanine ligase [Dysgonomonas sp. PH5-45]|uniref:D-alanine--D-alanine ligase n=1 Tax=unclassified Dysgonomonas TaxID=2630389 RepID=UPI00247547CB|nr:MULTISPECIES: D-alanine--D-alanine ligase [unclassified Dysgonomonas]MDH6355769.1 D-alanine-D-alanine ligase [Dysgonomonas sp. PH5-45]MDH6388670.1 D-alanine-D-alanine ligase [Dysgonomonas sp. PH5-37]